MKLIVVNKSTILNRFVLHTPQRKIKHLAVITRRTNIKFGILKGGKLEKSQFFKQQVKKNVFRHFLKTLTKKLRSPLKIIYIGAQRAFKRF